jgi:1-deoxy-D-xylulose-5-phosphate reductoisomerase
MSVKVAVFGATGSVGMQTMEVLDAYRNQYEPFLLLGGHNVESLEQLGAKYNCPIYSPWLANFSREQLRDHLKLADILVYAVSSVDYLPELVNFLSQGKPVCLSTKEVIVEAWPFIKTYSDLIRPVDSEHNALWRLGAGHKGIDKLYVVGSGGSLREKSKTEIEEATLKDVMNHPVWQMGPKVTFDSALLINKSMEVIEASHLFGLDGENIEVIIEPSGHVHGVVDFCDGSREVLLSEPTMKLPIAYALSFPEYLPSVSSLRPLLEEQLNFRKPDTERFPCVELGHLALTVGYTGCMAFSVADQIAFQEFSLGHIRPSEVYKLLLNAIEYYRGETYPDTIEDYFELRQEMIEAITKEAHEI